MEKTTKQLKSEIRRLQRRLERNEHLFAAACFPLFVQEMKRQSR